MCDCVQDEKWSKSFDSKLQSLLTDLEVGLGSVLRHSHAEDSGKRSLSETDVLGEFLQLSSHVILTCFNFSFNQI